MPSFYRRPSSLLIQEVVALRAENVAMKNKLHQQEEELSRLKEHFSALYTPQQVSCFKTVAV